MLTCTGMGKSYFACTNDDNFNKIYFPLTMFLDYVGPCFPQLPQIISTLLYHEFITSTRDSTDYQISWLPKNIKTI